MKQNRPLLLLGCGFLGHAIARRARLEGRRVWATTRAPEHASALRELGIEPILTRTLGPSAVPLEVIAGSDVLVSFPPDGSTDAALAPAISGAAALAYVSSTAVYGQTRGIIDFTTPAAPADERGRRRLEAERIWQAAGASILRAPAIYGPGQGLHKRLRSGSYRLPGDGRQHVSRIHVEDLATLCLAALARHEPGRVYLVGDLAPCPHVEVAAWLSQKLGVPMPPPGPEAQRPPSLQADRQIDASHALETLHVRLAYPDYRAGYSAVLRTEQADSA